MDTKVMFKLLRFGYYINMREFHLSSFMSVTLCCSVFPLFYFFRMKLQSFWFILLEKDSIKLDFAKVLVKFNYVSVKLICIENHRSTRKGSRSIETDFFTLQKDSQ